MGAVERCAWTAVQNVLDEHRCNVVAFDTETTGLNGAVIQAAAVEISAGGVVVNTMSAIVPPPPNVRLEDAAVAVHGITHKRIQEESVPAAPFLIELVNYLNRSHVEGKMVVAHNSSFDETRLHKTLEWHGVTERLIFKPFCTMRNSKDHCMLMTARGKPKMPKNEELYRQLTGREASVDFGGLHDAVIDANVTAVSYVQGRRQGWW